VEQTAAIISLVVMVCALINYYAVNYPVCSCVSSLVISNCTVIF